MSPEPNLSPQVKRYVSDNYKLKVMETGRGDGKRTCGPEDIFYYLYAVLWAPAFRSRYDEFLKIAFPRVPFPESAKRLFAVSKLGEELARLHLLNAPAAKLPSYPVAGSNKVVKARYDEANSRLYINEKQYLSNVPAHVLEQKIGCYTVVQKWLSERKGSVLSSGEVDHLRKVVGALGQVPQLLSRVDAAITAAPSLV